MFPEKSQLFDKLAIKNIQNELLYNYLKLLNHHKHYLRLNPNKPTNFNPVRIEINITLIDQNNI